jgi:hypothetical protein
MRGPSPFAFVTFVLLAACGTVPHPKTHDGGSDAPWDTGQADAGEADTGQADTGQADAGQADAGEADAGEADAGSAWVDAGPVVPPQGMLGDPVAVQAGDGTFVFALDQAGAVAMTVVRQGRSTPWHSLGGQLAGKPAVIVNGTGAPQLFARARDGTIATAKRAPDRASFTTWSSLRVPGSGAGGDPSVVRWRAQYLAVFVRDGEGSVWTTWQTGDTNDPSWRPWTKLPVPDAYPMFGRTSAAMSLGNYLYLSWRGDTMNDVRMLWQAAPEDPPEGAWRNFSLTHPMDVAIASDPYLGYLPSGLFFVVARGSDDAIWWNFQIQGVGGWTSWLTSGGTCLGQPSVVPNRGGGSQVFCRGGDNTLETVSLPSPEMSFSPWWTVNDDVKLAGDPYAIVNGEGAIQVFARDLTGRTLTTVQTGSATSFTQLTPVGAGP